MLDNSANVSAVNNDGELAIDISESDEMEEILQKEIDKQGINCDESRNTEERLMLEDARSWVNGKIFGDVPHNKTGATALHVAAAKGYIKVMGLLIQSGASVNSQVNIKKIRQIEVDNSQTVPNRNIFTNFMGFEFLQIFLVKLKLIIA